MKFSKQKQILIFIDWFLPGYKAGGPIKSVRNIVSIFSAEYDFWIITGDRDLGDDAPYPDIPKNQWIQREDCHVMYLSPDKQVKKTYIQFIRELSPGIIYFNSMFSYRFTILPMIANNSCGSLAKVIIAPRGMLGVGSINIKKTKKTFFLLACRYSRFFKNVIWQASSATEEQDIKKNIGKTAVIKIAMNLSNSMSNTWFSKIKLPGVVDFFFVSRISKIKNLLFAIERLSTIRSANITFHIIGTTEEPEYWEQCQLLISKLPDNISVNYIGQVENSKLHDIIKNYHFMLFPTFHENFGHAIAESLQAGCPVIISDQTPWRNLEEKSIGWDISLNDASFFTRIIEYCANMEQSEYDQMSRKTFEYAQNFINNSEIIEQNRSLFES